MKKYKSVYLYKTGRFQEDFEYLFPNIKIKKYIIDDKRKNYKGKQCINIKNLTNDINEMIVICDRKSDELIKKLKGYGLIENINYMFFEDFGILLNEKKSIIEKIKYNYAKSNSQMYDSNNHKPNSELLKKMIYTDPTHNLNCREPFRYAQIEAKGLVYPCCPAFLQEYIGNIFLSTPNKVWNSNRAKIIRLSIINKTYAFCNLNYCRLSENDINESKSREENLEASKIPEYTVIGFDESCNLKCKSCRNCTVNNNNNKKAIYICDNIAKKLFNAGWLNKSKQLVLATQGEVFFSNIYQKILFSNKIKDLNALIIHTNGTLLSPKKLEKLCNHCKTNNIDYVTINVSVDSVNEKTYADLRTGGNLKILKRNLEAISKARNEGKLYYVNVVVVLQRANYKELPEIARYMIDLKFDKLDVQTITNWGTFSNEEFENVCMLDENGNPKPELKEVLKDPIFNSNEIDFAGNIFKSETYMN